MGLKLVSKRNVCNYILSPADRLYTFYLHSFHVNSLLQLLTITGYKFLIYLRFHLPNHVFPANSLLVCLSLHYSTAIKGLFFTTGSFNILTGEIPVSHGNAYEYGCLLGYSSCSRVEPGRNFTSASCLHYRFSVRTSETLVNF
jgi:hypothetical protein